MFNTTIIEVAIGLVFLFSLIAILVTQINSVIISMLSLRSHYLERGLKELITDKQLQARLLAHPLIKMVPVSVPVNVQLTKEAADAVIGSGSSDVNYVPSDTFVESLMSLLLNDSNAGIYDALQKAVNALPSSIEKSRLRELLSTLRENFSEETIREIYTVINQITDPQFRQQLLDGLKSVEDILEKFGFNSNQLVPLLNGIRQIEDPKLKSALNTILMAVDNLKEAREKIAQWFDDGMSKAAEMYKARIQAYSIVVALVITIMFNVDTVHLARTLWENPQLRQDIAAAAAQFEGEEQAIVIIKSPEDAQDLEQAAEEARQTIQTLLDLQLPIGWGYQEVSQELIDTSLAASLPDPRESPRNLWNFFPWNNPNWLPLLFWKIVGIAVTTIAAAQGAPFWFDILHDLTKRFTGGRS